MIHLKSLLIISLSLLSFLANGQSSSINHWETVVFADDTWHYLLGYQPPPTDWNQASFTPTNWSIGQGGIGYDDGDDNTIISPTLSLFMRLDFEIVDASTILAAILHADYDDAFVAYLNGHEIARANIGTVGVPPAYNEPADFYSEAVMYQGQDPQEFVLSDTDLNQYLNEGTNTLAIQVHNQAISSSDMSSIFFLSVGLSDESTDYDPVPDWFSAPFFASNLPLIKINTNGQSIIEDVKITADMQVIDNGVGQLNYVDGTPNAYDNKIGIEVRGASSVWFDKQGFGIETRDAEGNNNNVSLLGMPSENDWVLHGPYSDKSLIRNFLTYHIGGRLGRYAPRSRLCEVFFNNQYWGVYLLVEKIKRDDNRVDIATLTDTDITGDELTGGYILKIDRDDGPGSGWYSPNGAGFYAFHHPKAADLHPLQKEYLQNHFNDFESMMANPQFNNPTLGYPAWIDVPSFVDFLLIQEINKNIDAFRLSTFMYKEKDSKGGKIHAGPIWDFNLGYGNENYCHNGDATGWAFNYNESCGSPFPFIWDRLTGDANFRNAFHCRWNELRSTVLHTDSIFQFIDSVTLELDDAQTRNFERWDILGSYVWPNAFVGDSYLQEVNFLKGWIIQRLEWMDANMIGDGSDCTVVSSTSDLTQNFRAYPNPFKDYLSFETTNRKSMTVELYDVLGRTVQSIQLEESHSFYQLDASGLTSGVYFYVVYEEGMLVSNGKVVKE